jgi:hypothetical protein
MRTLRLALAIPVAVAIVAAGCGGDDEAADAPATTMEASTTAAPSTAAPASESTADTSAAATTAAPTTAAPTTAAPTTAPATSVDVPTDDNFVEITVSLGVDDAVTLGGRVEPVQLGADVSLRLYDDAQSQEYHVHGFDLTQEVPAGVEAVFEFTADQPGAFDVTIHNADHDVIVVLDVA